MASDIRKCDVCGTVFRVDEVYYNRYQLKLPSLAKLENTIEDVKDGISSKSRRGLLFTWEYDLCNHCLLRLCEVLQGLHSIRGKEPQ